ncbi:defense protein l(2)34Fc-like [Eleutherodactylus coqui]|uniref:defense protein l(2)34Fc-like n=1 Tax=Eleutherodactylus coqui TaxID=57060 RepID=UPI003462F715
MKPSARIFTLQLLMFLPMYSNGYPNGKVEMACTTMMPQHGAAVQSSIPPYSLSISSVNHTGILGFRVTLMKNPSQIDFKGFMIQARAPGSAIPQGTFVVNNTEGLAQTLNCSAFEDTVSHTSPSPKSNVSVIWLPPKRASTDIRFSATVVQNRTIFWTQLFSETIRLNSGGPHLLAPTFSQLLLCSTVLIYALRTI